MRELENSTTREEARLSGETIKLKDPHRVLHRAANHWSSAVRYVSLLRLDRCVPASTDFAKTSLLPELLKIVDSKSSRMELRKASEMAADLLQYTGVSEDQELSAGSRVISAFQKCTDAKTKVALAIAADRLGCLTLDMTSFLSGSAYTPYDKYPAEVGVLLITHGNNAKKGLTLIHGAIRDEKACLEQVAFSLSISGHIGKLWDYVKNSSDHAPFIASFELLDIACDQADRERLAESLYQLVADTEVNWNSNKQSAAIGFLKNISDKTEQRSEIQKKHVMSLLLTNKVDFYNTRSSLVAEAACSRFPELMFSQIFDLAVQNSLPKENLSFIRKLFRNSPVHARLAYHEAIENLQSEEEDLRKKVTGYCELNKETVNSLHARVNRVHAFWSSVREAVEVGFDNLCRNDPDFAKRYIDFLSDSAFKKK